MSFLYSIFSTLTGSNSTSKGPPKPARPASMPSFSTTTTQAAFAAATVNNRRVTESSDRYSLVDKICSEADLYCILGLTKSCSTDDIRRAYIGRSRVCHPDKFPEYPKATEAFQKLSFAYETLSKPSTRRAYDISGPGMDSSVSGNGDETLHGVLYQLFLEFMDGDFEMIRALVNALNEGNPGLNLGDDAIETLESAFRRMRDTFLAGQKYLGIVQFELIRMYEIQHQLRGLGYFDVFGRLRLTLQLARVTLSIPMQIDAVMKREEAEALGKRIGGAKPVGLLGDRMCRVLGGVVMVLERGETCI